MVAELEDGGETSYLLAAVALPRDLPERAFLHGQVGTIVEALDDATSLVEFSDESGHAYAIFACPREALPVLRTIHRVA
jgi:hypothetical protein